MPTASRGGCNASLVLCTCVVEQTPWAFPDELFSGFEHGACQKWGEYMQVALPATLMSCAELWFGHIGEVVIGFSPAEEDLAAHVTAINFVNVSFMPVFGLSATAAALVGRCESSIESSADMQRRYRSQSCFVDIDGHLHLSVPGAVGGCIHG